LHKRAGNANKLPSLSAEIAARDEIFTRIRFYACPYAVYKTQTLGKGFLFLQSEETLAIMSLGMPKDWNGHRIEGRSIHVHFLTVGEYEQEVCREDFEMTSFRDDIIKAVNEYNEKAEVVVLMKFRCGHMALGTSKLVPEFALCKQLGKEYYGSVTAGSVTLNLDE